MKSRISMIVYESKYYCEFEVVVDSAHQPDKCVELPPAPKWASMSPSQRFLTIKTSILGTFLSRLGKNNDLDALILTFDALWALELSQKETKSSIYHNRSKQLLSLSQLRKYSNWKTINFKLKRHFKAIVSSFSTNNKGFWFYSTQLFPIIVNIFIQRDYSFQFNQ